MAEEVTFRGIRSNEVVLQTAKNHAWVLMPITYAWFILGSIAAVIIHFFGVSGTMPYYLLILGLLGFAYSYRLFFLWNNGIYILTNQRVIKIDQISLFNRTITEVEIDKIQEISTSVDGPIKTILNFGTVHIRTAASAVGQADLINVANPYDLQQSILRVHNEQKRTPPVAIR